MMYRLPYRTVGGWMPPVCALDVDAAIRHAGTIIQHAGPCGDYCAGKDIPMAGLMQDATDQAFSRWLRWGAKNVSVRGGLFTAGVAVNQPCLEGDGITHLMIGADRCSCHRDRFVDQEIGDG